MTFQLFIREKYVFIPVWEQAELYRILACSLKLVLPYRKIY